MNLNILIIHEILISPLKSGRITKLSYIYLNGCPVVSNKSTQINWKYPLFIWQTTLNTNHHEPITGGDGGDTKQKHNIIN